jgi:hypothetical protein
MEAGKKRTPQLTEDEGLPTFFTSLTDANACHIVRRRQSISLFNSGLFQAKSIHKRQLVLSKYK